MTMRDLQRLEELSSAAALGLWADDIVLALDRATSDVELADADTKLLTDAAEMLEAALERTEHPLATPKSARGLAATNTALNFVATLVRQQPGTDEKAILQAMASVLREAATGSANELTCALPARDLPDILARLARSRAADAAVSAYADSDIHENFASA